MKKRVIKKIGTILFASAFFLCGVKAYAGTTTIQTYLTYDYNDIPLIVNDSATAFTCVEMNSTGYPTSGYSFVGTYLYISSSSFKYNTDVQTGISCMEPGAEATVSASTSVYAKSYHKGTFNYSNLSAYPYATDTLYAYQS